MFGHPSSIIPWAQNAPARGLFSDPWLLGMERAMNSALRDITDADNIFADLYAGGEQQPADTPADQPEAPPAGPEGQAVAAPEHHRLYQRLLMRPRLDVACAEDRCLITADVPGIPKADLHLSVDKDVLTLTGERKEERRDAEGHFERAFGRFQRSVRLPAGSEPDKISAKYEDGVLRIEVPRGAAASQGTEVAIQ